MNWGILFHNSSPLQPTNFLDEINIPNREILEERMNLMESNINERIAEISDEIKSLGLNPNIDATQQFSARKD